MRLQKIFWTHCGVVGSWKWNGHVCPLPWLIKKVTFFALAHLKGLKIIKLFGFESEN